MIKVIVLNKSAYSFYERLVSFCTLQVNTDHGPFIFQFKEDRRKGRREWLITRTYIVELVPPADLLGANNNIKENIVLAIKIFLFKPNYRVLTEVLADIYIETMLKENSKVAESP